MPKRKPHTPLPRSGKCSVCAKRVSTRAMKSHAAKHKGKRVSFQAKY